MKNSLMKGCHAFAYCFISKTPIKINFLEIQMEPRPDIRYTNEMVKPWAIHLKIHSRNSIGLCRRKVIKNYFLCFTFVRFILILIRSFIERGVVRNGDFVRKGPCRRTKMLRLLKSEPALVHCSTMRNKFDWKYVFIIKKERTLRIIK